MAGSQTLRVRGGRFAVALAVSLLTFAGLARAQAPLPPLPETGMPERSFADIVTSTPETTDGPMNIMPPSYYPPPRVVQGIFGTITESVFGHPDPDTWGPAAVLDTLQREVGTKPGCRHPTVRAARPRQGWIQTPRTVACTGCGSSHSPRLSTKATRATPTSVPTRSTRRLSRRLLLIHEHSLRAPQQPGWQRVTNYLSVRDFDESNVEEPHDIRRISRSRPASCCTRRKTSRSRPRSRRWCRPATIPLRGRPP